MAFAACFTCTFQSQGASCPDNSKPNSAYMGKQVEIQAWKFGVKAPHDIATGQMSGKRQHSPVQITKEQGPFDVMAWQAACTNETIKTLVLQVYRTQTNKVGQGATAGKAPEVLYWTITLTNAQVAEVRTSTAFANVEGGTSAKHTSGVDTHELTTIDFTYQKIEIAAVQDKKSASDDWQL
jgi:type VI secretion system Hcp family effector